MALADTGIAFGRRASDGCCTVSRVSAAWWLLVGSLLAFIGASLVALAGELQLAIPVMLVALPVLVVAVRLLAKRR